MDHASQMIDCVYRYKPDDRISSKKINFFLGQALLILKIIISKFRHINYAFITQLKSRILLVIESNTKTRNSVLSIIFKLLFQKWHQFFFIFASLTIFSAPLFCWNCTNHLSKHPTPFNSQSVRLLFYPVQISMIYFSM